MDGTYRESAGVPTRRAADVTKTAKVAALTPPAQALKQSPGPVVSGMEQR
jgi:hypothetical protein